MSVRKPAPDVPVHISYKNVRDGRANDSKNCTFGQCDAAREKGMDFYIDPNPLAPTIWAEWTETGPLGGLQHHRGNVVRRHPDGTETPAEAITIVSLTDNKKGPLLKRFPRSGMDFVITNHTYRASEAERESAPPEVLKARRDKENARARELAALRKAGLAEPPKRRRTGARTQKVRARFGDA